MITQAFGTKQKKRQEPTLMLPGIGGYSVIAAFGVFLTLNLIMKGDYTSAFGALLIALSGSTAAVLLKTLLRS